MEAVNFPDRTKCEEDAMKETLETDYYLSGSVTGIPLCYPSHCPLLPQTIPASHATFKRSLHHKKKKGARLLFVSGR